ncbi:hypothetical protein LEMLEM_LOCUS9006 [Lemmus lemmus]
MTRSQGAPSSRSWKVEVCRPSAIAQFLPICVFEMHDNWGSFLLWNTLFKKRIFLEFFI